MAFANNIGPAQRGLVNGSANYAAFLQNTAIANEQLANAQYIEEQQRAGPPAGVQIPVMAQPPMAAPGMTIPSAVARGSAGIMPQQSWAPWENLPQAPLPGPAPLTPPGAEWSPTLPEHWGKQSAGDGWAVPWRPAVPHNEALYPTQNVGLLQGAANRTAEAFINTPTNLMNGVSNVVTRPLVNGLQFLGQPPGAPTPEVSQNIERAGSPAGAALPPSGVSGAPPTAGLSGPASPYSSGADGKSAGVAGLPSSSATPASFPSREIRDEALRMPSEMHDYYLEQFMQQRQQITDDVNRQTQFIEQQKQQLATVNQQKLNRLQQDAIIAQRTGNIGLMKRLQDQSENILLEATTGLQQFDSQQMVLREGATVAYRDNERNIWQQQALQAEADFINLGDPSRLLQIFEAYGYPIQIQDAGKGMYRVIDITGNGKGRVRGGKTYTPEEIGDMFHSMLSDEFRQGQAAAQAEEAKSMRDFMRDLEKIDFQGAIDIKKAVATEMAKGKKYLQQSAEDGSIVYYPEDGSGNIIVYNPNPPEIPNSGGLFEPKVKLTPTGQ